MYLIKSGALFEQAESGETEFVSPFALERVEAERSHAANRNWRNQAEDDPQALVPRNMLWGAGGRGTTPGRPTFLFCQRVGTRLYYVLAMSKTRGLFYYDTEQKKEVRLFHREDFDPHGMFVTPDYSIFTTRTIADGSAHLVKMDELGKLTQEITSGDCYDEYPFLSGSDLYYQTAGLARTPEGMIFDSSSIAINRVDLRSGTIETLAEHHDFDYLLPKADAKGNLYCIKRPHLYPQQFQLLPFLKDVVLFPFRLLSAIFGFLNVFSMFFGKKPLMTAGGPDHQIDISRRLIHGRWLDIEESSKKEGRRVAVPRDWQLVQITPGQPDRVVATSVVWFDLDAEGRPVYSDGFNVFSPHLAKPRTSDDLIQFLHIPSPC